ncbi:MAG: hypothetical protein KU37_08995 [Sulfuricurvum sp. PC08-66]|nr:MAG: hypothetical protein KU37_08995 [Sulfuricurvum sp. PC08-66]
MAAGSTVCKAQLNIANMDTHYYETHDLTLAQHPSETDERLMMRLVAFALHASDRLALTKGVGGEEEPQLWQKNYAGEIELWIELGQIEEKRLRKACGKSEQVILYTYNHHAATAWWRQNSATLARFGNLRVIHIDAPDITHLYERSMRLQCNISDGILTLHSDRGDITVTQEIWQ